MSRLARYYNSRVASLKRNDFLTQVGHTEQGRPVTDAQFKCLLVRICSLLELGPEDDVLDVCCGNGIFTYHIAKNVRSAVGIDFSSSMIEIARESHHLDNLQYHVLNALDLEHLGKPESQKFTRILMHGALQHFKELDFELLLNSMLNISIENPIILIGFVPQKDKKNFFYNTPKRKFDYIVRRASGRDVMGTWWDKSFIIRTCEKLGLHCAFQDVDKSLDASRYRFDVKISRRPDHPTSTLKE